ncbi:MAG: glycosyltransferase family 39 protein [bacterium]
MGTATLLPLAGLAWATLFWRKSGHPLDALLKSSLVFVWASFGFSELAGLFHCLTSWAAILFWSLATLVPLFLARHEGPRPLPEWSRPSPLVVTSLCLAALIAGITLCLALGQPQWNIDAQLYHLPRVEQWIQNRCLALYPTPYDLQDFFPPGTELLALQYHLLAGSAVLVGAVQWAAYLLAGAAVAGVARALGANTRAAALAVLVWAATPMAVAQSSTAQSDLTAAFGAVLTAYFCLRHDRNPEGRWDLWCAAALGAALLLKGTDYLFVPCFGLWVLLRRDWRRPQAMRPVLLLLLMAAPNLPYWYKNFALCGNPLGSSSMHLLQDPGAATILSNGLKSLGDELRVPSQMVNAAVVRAVSDAHAILHLPLNNPHWVFATISPYGDPHYARFCTWWHEDYSGAPLQTLGLLALLVASALRPLGWRRRYWAAGMGGALLYLALVRWNLWDTRLELPLYALAAAPLGLAVGRLRRKTLPWACVALLATQGLWAACADKGHPLAELFSPQLTAETVAANVPGIESGYQAALRGSSIGLLERPRCCPENGSCEFGVWMGAHRVGTPVRIQHLIASPATAPLLELPPWNRFRPDVIVADRLSVTAPAFTWGDRRWLRLGGDEVWQVYLPIGAPISSHHPPRKAVADLHGRAPRN